MRRRRRDGFLTLMIQLFGLEPVEQRLFDAQMSFGHRLQRMHVRVSRVLPIAAVSAALTLYAAGVVALTVRRRRAESGAEAVEPAAEGTPPESAEAGQTEAVEIAV